MRRTRYKKVGRNFCSRTRTFVMHFPTLDFPSHVLEASVWSGIFVEFPSYGSSSLPNPLKPNSDRCSAVPSLLLPSPPKKTCHQGNGGGGRAANFSRINTREEEGPPNFLPALSCPQCPNFGDTSLNHLTVFSPKKSFPFLPLCCHIAFLILLLNPE